jgi:hypothetical protein
MQLGAFRVASDDADHALPGSQDGFTLAQFVQQLDLSQSWVGVELVAPYSTGQASKRLVPFVEVQ